MPPFLRWTIALGLVGGAVFWGVTRPDPLPEDALAGLNGDAARGEQVFLAAGCASCHVSAGAEGEEAPVLAGGMRFPSDFGTFIAPNISSDPVYGVGSWSDYDLANAITRGISPEGAHYYPAFPYDAYNKAELGDIVDLIAYMRTLPASEAVSQAHEVGFPFNIRRTLGGWKTLFVTDEWAIDGDLSPEATRGRYLVEALGHCSACHTPRNLLGGPDTAQWLAGAPNPDGKGRVPNITPAVLDWSEADIAEYLSSGFTPEFDTAGGHMVAVVEKFAKLPESDRAAVAAYLKAVPGVK
ncbi:cytochrome c [Oceaniglobus ichthyenteri]|uniref:cytochrome c n=1 Tax=Oceaniglobus ichthyenteri TaxID=2136177 RepID=UPI000D38FE09|nr:cytochrome c [Oceaniglobus ichthyenteri]